MWNTINSTSAPTNKKAIPEGATCFGSETKTGVVHIFISQFYSHAYANTRETSTLGNQPNVF